PGPWCRARAAADGRGPGRRYSEHVRAQARAAHAEQDDVGVGAAVGGELAKLGRMLEHLLGDVQPAEAVADLLSFGRVRRPQRRILGPQASRRVRLLEVRHARVDAGLERAEAVPLPRALPRLDVQALLLDRGEQALERFRERLDALDLDLACDLVQVDAARADPLHL